MLKKTVGLLVLIGITLLFSAYKSNSSVNLLGNVDPNVIVLSKNNTLVLGEEVTPESTAKLFSKAREMDKDDISGPLYLVLNTPGGEVQSGVQFIDNMSSLNREVKTVTIFAASMGFQIVQGLGDRIVTSHGILMSHRAAGGMEGAFGGIRPSQLDNRYNLYLSLMQDLDLKTVARTKGKQTLESYQKAYSNELWLAGDHAVEQGYADSVKKIRCDASLSGTETHKAQLMGLQVTYSTDKCPINTGIFDVQIEFPTNQGMKTYKQFLAEGGQFGPVCQTAALVDKSLLCARDPGLSETKVKEIKSNFVDSVDLHKKMRISF